MIEVSFIEIILLIWAVAATAAAFDFKHKARMSVFIVNKLLEDPSVYKDMLSSYNSFKRQHNA